MSTIRILFLLFVISWNSTISLGSKTLESSNFRVFSLFITNRILCYELADAVLSSTNISYTPNTPTHNDYKGREFWAGWILAYYQWFSGRRFEDIVKGGLPLSAVLSMYILHEADESKFVGAAEEILKRNSANKKSFLNMSHKNYW